MSQNQKYALVFLSTKRKTSVIPEELFEKSFKENGMERPLCEGSVRIAHILNKRYECKILRLCCKCQNVVVLVSH